MRWTKSFLVTGNKGAFCHVFNISHLVDEHDRKDRLIEHFGFAVAKEMKEHDK